LFHLDCDEFLVNETALVGYLADLPEETWSVILPVAERIFEGRDGSPDIFKGLFRTRLEDSEDREILRKIYGPRHKFLKAGLAGHLRGKAGVRVGSPARLNLHECAFPEGVDAAAHSVRLPWIGHLHFDAWYFEAWLRKCERIRVRSSNTKARQLLVDAVAEAKSDSEKRDIFATVYELDTQAIALLDKHGHIYRSDFDIRASLQKVFPGLDVDLTKSRLEDHQAGRRSA
jgi:hypothetical protein